MKEKIKRLAGKIVRDEQNEQLGKALRFGEHYGSLTAFLDSRSREYSQEEALLDAAKEFYRDLPSSDPVLVEHLVISIGDLIGKYEGLPETVKELLGDRFHRDLKKIKDANPEGSEIYNVVWKYLSEDTRYPYIL